MNRRLLLYVADETNLAAYSQALAPYCRDESSSSSDNSFDLCVCIDEEALKAELPEDSGKPPAVCLLDVDTGKEDSLLKKLRELNGSVKLIFLQQDLQQDNGADWRDGVYHIDSATAPATLAALVDALMLQAGDTSSPPALNPISDIFNAIDYALFLVSHDGRIVYCNRAASSMTGHTVEELHHIQFPELLWSTLPDNLESERKRVIEALQSGKELISDEFLVATKSAPTFAAGIAVKPLNAEGDNDHSVVLVRDISESKRKDELIRTSRDKLFTVLDSLDAAVYVADLETYEILFANKILWDARGNVIGKKCWEVMHPESGRICRHCNNDKLIDEHGKPSGIFEWEFQNPSNNRWYAIRDQAINWYDGRVVRLEISVDITKMKNAERQIAEAKTTVERERDKLRSMIEGMEEGIIVIDEQDRITEINTWLLSLWNRSHKQMIGKRIWDIDFEHVTARLKPVLLQFKSNIAKRALSINTAMSNLQISLRVQPISRNDTYSGAILNFINVTDLIEARNTAEKANLAKTEFLANISHEIRTPIHGVLGMTSLLLGSELSTEQREYANTVYSSADHLMELLNEILDFSKIEAGEFEIDLQNFNLSDTVHEAVNLMSAKAEEKSIELLAGISPGIPNDLIGDPFRIRQVLLNLISNAIKFTDKGEVALQVEVKSRDDSDAVLLFTVRDTGIGIPVEKQVDIFKAFTQVDTSTTRKYSGTGLGLAISARIVEMMGGQLWVESINGEGSVFSFTARLGVQPHPQVTSVPDSIGLYRDLRTMIVDDNATNRRILNEMLEQWELDVVVFDNAAAALGELTRAEADGNPYRLVIIDAHMPKMDGFELAERVKQNPALAKSTVMMLSSGDMMGASARCRKLNISAYLMKPVRPDELLKAILQALKPPETPELSPREAEPIASSGKTLKILFAEDNVVNQKIVATALRKRGHLVAIASNGLEALEMLDSAPYELLLLDIQMPELDGFETAREIRKRETGTDKHIPIIAMTAHALQGDRERCLQIGMDGYISKPIDPEDLIRMIESINPDQIQATGGNSETPVFDEKALMRRVEGDENLAIEFSKLFLEDAGRQVEDLKGAVAKGLTGDIERIAHMMKGSAASIGAESLSESLQALWHIAVAGQAEKSGYLFENVEDEFIRLKKVLQNFVDRS